jgi:hypothetical protein
MAFPNTYYSNLEPAGKIKNMPEVTNEVNMMLGIANTDGQSENRTLKPWGLRMCVICHGKT